jgi:hypothetical protein
MSMMIACTLLGLFTFSTLCASDVDQYPPGEKPFHSPKAPTPNGVFASDACYGFHTTKWTPWNQACGNCGTTGTPLTQSCTSSAPAAMIYFDPLPETPASAPLKIAPGTTTPAPESPSLNMPMPPVKK